MNHTIFEGLSMQLSRNLFSRLFRLASRQGENFITESLVFVTEYLLKDTPSVGQSFLNWLCWSGSDFGFHGRLPTIGAWKVTEQGTPDIVIAANSENSFVLVEVKVESTLGEDQVERYLKRLDEEEEAAKKRNQKLARKLVLLTKDFVPHAMKMKDYRIKPVTWSDVADWLKNNAISSDCLVGEFLVKQFYDFLKMQGLTNEKIGQDIPFVKMIEDALKRANLPGDRQSPFKHKLGTGQWWYVDRKKCWVHYFDSEPRFIYFYIDKRKLDDVGRERLREMGADKDSSGSYFTLDLEAEGYDDQPIDEKRISLLTRRFEEYHRYFRECLKAIQ
jgi:hypothetical protein